MARLPLTPPAFGHVTIGSSPAVSLFTPAWECVNSYLLTDPAPRRRNNRIRPGVDGVYGGRAKKDQWTVELELTVIGDWNHLGVAQADPAAGEEINWRYLVDNIQEQATDAQGRLPVTVTGAVPGKSYTGFIQIGRMYREPIKGTSCVHIEATLPSGGLVYA